MHLAISLAPLLTASPALLIHIAAAIPAILLGPVALYRSRRDRTHRVLGRIWVASMVLLSVSSLWIPAGVFPLLWGFGPIHALSVFVLVMLGRAILAIRRRDVAAHGAIMRSLYWQALLLAGLFTLVPGRDLNAVLFGEARMLGLWVIGLVGVAVLGWTWRRVATGGSDAAITAGRRRAG